MTPPRSDDAQASPLSRLAELFGIVPEFTDNDGNLQVTPDHTTRALLAAMGTDASTDAAVRGALDAHQQARDLLLLPALAVVKAHADRGVRVALTVPQGWGARPARCRLVLHHEDGGRTELERRMPLPAQGHSFGLWIRPCPGPGYHRLQATLAVDGEERAGEQQLVVRPGSCAMPLAADSRVFGLWANLYSLRSARNWGFGDFGDLAKLAQFGGSVGAAFTGVNPLHALHDDVGSTSPYSPISRLFTNPLYLDVEAIPEFGDDHDCQAAWEQPSFQRALASAREQTRLDYPALWKLKRPLLLLAHKAFTARHATAQTSRGRDYRRWCAEQGEALQTFATFMALCDARPGNRHDWREWPRQWSDQGSAEVADFAEQHPDAVDFQRWLQFECDRQLGHAASTARESGQRLGLYNDLAIGTPPWAADIWAQPELFVKGVRIGCPPDAFASEGQDWNLTPLSPVQLMDGGWRYWRSVLRAAMAHGGVLRIDHVMGLFRQYWIPAGASAKEGAYVRFPSEALLGILCLESSRHNTLVVGEDLGTVPKGLPAQLAQRKILSSRVALFERDRQGAFRPSSSFSKRALLTATTHDLPPLDALWGDDDLVLRRTLGQIPDDEGLAAAQEERRALLAALQRRVSRGPSTDATAAASSNETAEIPGANASKTGRDDSVPASVRSTLRRDVYRWLSATPAPLLGVSLDDLCGETEPVNIPGVDEETHPSWSRRMTVPLEQLAEQEGLGDVWDDLSERDGRRI